MDLAISQPNADSFAISWQIPQPPNFRLRQGWLISLFILGCGWYAFGPPVFAPGDGGLFQIMVWIGASCWSYASIVVLTFLFRGTYSDRTESVTFSSHELIYSIPAPSTMFFYDDAKEDWRLESHNRDFIGLGVMAFTGRTQKRIGSRDKPSTQLKNDQLHWELRCGDWSEWIGPFLEEKRRKVVVMAISRWLQGQTIQQNLDATRIALEEFGRA